MQCDWNKALNLYYGRLNDCLMDINDGIPIDLYDQLRHMKLELILWAMNEANKNVSHAAKMLNMKRSTMITMVTNELDPLIAKKKREKRRLKDRLESVNGGL